MHLKRLCLLVSALFIIIRTHARLERQGACEGAEQRGGCW
jgi:hypothetical protein